MRKPLILMLLIAGLIAVPAIEPAVAFAAGGPVLSQFDVRLIQSQNGSPVTLVSGDLATGTPLPATVRLAVPTGTTIAWAGEILGGDPSKDPSVTYKTTPRGSFDEVALTLTKARRGQVEYRSPGAVATAGGTTTATVTWTAPADAPRVILSVIVPAGATIADAGGATKQSLSGSQFYTKAVGPVKAGQRVSLRVAYTGGSFASPVGTQPQGAAATGSGPNVGAIVAFLLAVVVAGIFFTRPKRAGDPADEEPVSEPRPRRRAVSPADEPSADDDAFDEATAKPATTSAGTRAAKSRAAKQQPSAKKKAGGKQAAAKKPSSSSKKPASPKKGPAVEAKTSTAKKRTGRTSS